MHLRGDGCPQSFTEAARWFTLSADEGFQHSVLELPRCLIELYYNEYKNVNRLPHIRFRILQALRCPFIEDVSRRASRRDTYNYKRSYESFMDHLNMI